jgi:F0F1-type ATP synthase membrane subunit b/b'
MPANLALPDNAIMQAVERLDYRATVGDVATQAGLNVDLAQQGLLGLAAQVGGHLQVAESGEVVYLFPQNFRTILRDKFFQIQLREWLQRIWRVVFYLIRISFGIVLIGLILAAIVAIFIVVLAMNSSRDDNDRGYDGDFGGGMSMGYWWGPDIFWFFDPNYDNRRRPVEAKEMNFLEAVFSFLFGDGNPNANLEDRRWQTIGAVIRNQRGAVIAEQIAAYLDDVGTGFAQEYEDYMLPVLARFDGRPEVSPEGQIVYHFPSLQATVNQQQPQTVPSYLREQPWRFSRATSGQVGWAIGLGCLLLVLGLTLTGMTGGIAAGLMGGVIKAIAVLATTYSFAYLAIPLIRYFWLQGRNQKIAQRNAERQQRTQVLQANNSDLQQKLAYAQQFAAETVIQQSDLVYTTETDLVDQELERKDAIDAEWQRRINQSRGG